LDFPKKKFVKGSMVAYILQVQTMQMNGITTTTFGHHAFGGGVNEIIGARN
jgi:hypothetical protein